MDLEGGRQKTASDRAVTEVGYLAEDGECGGFDGLGHAICEEEIEKGHRSRGKLGSQLDNLVVDLVKEDIPEDGGENPALG